MEDLIPPGGLCTEDPLEKGCTLLAVLKMVDKILVTLREFKLLIISLRSTRQFRIWL
jgi:hypothetical protein